MNILLVLPAAQRYRINNPDQKVPRREMLRFSILPLTSVAALTPHEHRVTICDENVQAIDFDADVDLVGVSFMTALAPRAYEIAEEFRRRGTVVVAGGYHPTLCTAEVVRHFDAVVAGEAEGIWPQLLEDFAAGRLHKVYQRSAPAAPQEIPAPRRDLFGDAARHYVTTNAVQTGRGCAHRCTYCSIAAFHHSTHRNRPIANVIQELRTIPRHFIFIDDNIIADPEYAKELFRSMAPLKKRWVSQCSLHIADDAELLQLAYQAGCRGLFIGIESLSAANLGAVGKAFNAPDHYRQRLAAIRRAGIGVIAGIIVGLDDDEPTVFERTLTFLESCRVDAVQVNILTPLPGTPLYEQFQHQGRIIDRDWSHYDFRHVIIRPQHMSPADLQAGADWLYAQFYRPDHIFRRALRGLFALGPLSAWMIWRLNRTYRYDNLREGIGGYNPAATVQRPVPVTHGQSFSDDRLRPIVESA